MAAETTTTVAATTTTAAETTTTVAETTTTAAETTCLYSIPGILINILVPTKWFASVFQ